MYDQGTQAVSRRRSVRTYPSGRSGRRTGHSQEQVRLAQLVVCFVLFLTIFLWKGIFPQKLVQVRDDVLNLISTDFNFQEALSNLGESLAGSETVLSDLGEFCIEVFGTAPQAPQAEPAETVSFQPPQPSDMLAAELQFLSGGPSLAARAAHYADFSPFGLEAAFPEEPAQPEVSPPAEEATEPEEPPAVPAAGTVTVISDYNGQPLPENYTMDQVSLGELETMTPVQGRLNSEYGYRVHPILGQNIFHGGVDIGGQMGDPIAAFAAGTVEYTGENDSYGLYLQVDHGNGVKSFYAHCSKIEVVKGQAVAMGDTVARIGSTGTSTGPHLHLELKFNKTHLNPAYYVDFLGE